MTRHRKRSRAPRHNADGTRATAGSETLKRTTSTSSASRIEASGLDLELIAEPGPLNAKLASMSSGPPTADGDDPWWDPGANERRQAQLLREELTEIGVQLDLPSKRRARAIRITNTELYGGPRRYAGLMQKLSPVIVFIGIAMVAASLKTPTAPTLPDALLGAWTTSSPSYRGRELGFVESEIAIRVAPGQEFTRYSITGMTTRMKADTMVLGLTYMAEGGPVELHARLVDGLHPTLIFDRPAGLVWERRQKK